MRRAAASGAACVERMVEYLESTGDPGPVHEAASRGPCPPSGLLEAALEQGYPEVVAEAAARGCSVPEEAASLAADALVLIGRGDKASILRPPGPAPRLLGAYCGSWVEAWDGSRVYSTRGMPPRLRARVEAGFEPSQVARGLGAPVAVSWGCGGGVPLEHLASLAYPDVPPSLEALRYHLALPDVPPSETVARAASAAARVLLESGAWRKTGMPAWLLEAAAGVDPGQRCPRASAVVVTDRPRRGCPLWSPRVVDATAAESIPGPAGAAALALAWRRADPEAARWGPEGLRAALASATVENPAGPGPGDQVEARHASTVEGRVEWDCLRPEWMCTAEAGLPAEPRVESPVRVLGYDPESIVDAASAALRAWGDRLLVAPSRLAARLVAASLGIPLLEDPSSWDEWLLSGGGAGVASWETLLSAPWLASRAAPVLLFPEAYPGVPGSVEAVASLASRLGGMVATRALPARGVEVVVEEAEPAGVEPARLPLEELADAAEEEFSRMWKGYSMRPYQRVAAALILWSALYQPEHPVMVVLPTGAGKTAVFLSAGQAARRLGLGGYVLVVSPLRALMRDQVESARRRGLRAERIDAGVPGRARARALDAARRGLLEVLYVTPERFMDEATASIVASQPPALVVLDEAHTVSRWGKSFRPSYLHAVKTLADLREATGRPPLALFTATAPPALAADVLAQAGARGEPVEHPLPLQDPEPPGVPLEAPLVLRGPVTRPELSFDVSPSPRGRERLVHAARLVSELAEWASSVSEPWIGVVYTGYVKRAREDWANADAIAEAIREHAGLEAISYHGQLPSGERRRREDAIYEASSTGRGPRVVVATKAFGMGIDIPNIRWVIHYTPSDSIEDYYQEAGRAGRDGLPARIVTLYDPGDFADKARLLRGEAMRPSQVLRSYNALAALWAAIRGETGGSPMIVLPAAALGSQTRALRAVAEAQRLGLLDYWTVRARLSGYRFPRGVEPSDYLPWYMELPGRVVVGPESRAASAVAERVPARFYRCASAAGVLAPVAVEAGGRRVEAGECREWLAVEHDREPVIVAYWPPGLEPSIIEEPDPDLFKSLVAGQHEEEERLEELHRLLEEAVRARARGGPEAADTAIRRGLEEYFQRPPPPPRPPPTHVMGRVVACPRAEDCIGHAVEALLAASEWLGPRGVTLAVQDENVAEEIVLAYTREAGERFAGRWRGAYRSIVAASRDPLRLLDYGFIVAVVRSGPRRSVLADRLTGYRYAALLLYAAP